MNISNKSITILLITSILLLLGGTYIIIIDKNRENYTTTIEQNLNDNSVTSNEEEIIDKVLKVHVAGQVINSDQVYTLPDGSIVNDAIEMAGGITESADLTYINLAAKIEDGQKIYIPSKEDSYDEIAKLIPDSIKSNGNSGLININIASKIELMTLKGIGESTAEKIITYRKESGGFNSIEDIKNVSGIGEATFNNIKDSITTK